MKCPECGGGLVKIGVSLGDTTIAMHSCSRCDRRWWERDGQLIDLKDVLQLAAARR